MSNYSKEGGTSKGFSPSWSVKGQRGRESTLPDLNSPASLEPTENDISSPEDESVYWTAKSLLKLSSSGGSVMMPSAITNRSHEVRICETCNRTFHSYQAFGGHLAGHVKRLKRDADKQSDDLDDDDGEEDPDSPEEKVYECKICLLAFPTGQALGGHMKYHGKWYARKFLAKKKREERLAGNVEDMDEEA